MQSFIHMLISRSRLVEIESEAPVVRSPEVAGKAPTWICCYRDLRAYMWDQEACLLLLLFYSVWYPRRHVETHQLYFGKYTATGQRSKSLMLKVT